MPEQALSMRLVLVRGGRDAALSDDDLVRALRQRDEGAPAVAWNRFLPTVRATLRRLLGPAAETDDLCQEVFLRFFRRIHDLREPAAVRAFLVAVCVRVARKEITRRWLRRFVRLTDDGVLPERATAGDRDGPCEARDALARYYRILDAIGGEARSIFVTRTIEGLELAQVARLHGLSLSTTQRRLIQVTKRVTAMVRADPTLASFVSPSRAGERP